MARSSKLSAKEKYERQKALTKERQRRYRERMSEEKKEEKKKYDRDRLARLKAENKIKKISDMTPREQRKMRKYWKERNLVRSLKKKSLKEVTDTPPASPLQDVREESEQKRRGRKKIRRDKAKAYRTVAKQQEKIKELEKKLAKYKKRLHREKKKHLIDSSPSPRKEVRNILRGEKVSPRVRKQLFLGCALKQQLKSQTKEVAHSKIKNQILHKVVGNRILKKYRVQTHFKDLVPYTANKIIKNSPSTSFEYTRPTKTSITKELSEKLMNFFEDDRVSKMCPGKKEFVKKGGIKKQRRILLDTLANLHKKFQKETHGNISKASFCRSRPFWVTFPKMIDRETCACVKHANMDLLIKALKVTNVIAQRSSAEVVKFVVCSTDSKECMLNMCSQCKSKEVKFCYEEDFLVKYQKWKMVEEQKVIKNEKKIVKKTVKVKEIAKVSYLKTYLKNELAIFKKHVFYAKHQAGALKNKIDNLSERELLFRLDFSENYVAKYEKEVQSVHFGASKRQLSLNTGVWYAKVGGTTKTTCFASASDNLDHQAHAVWGHMKPVFLNASQQFPATTAVHIFTDSPSSQYRNRINLYLLKTLLPKYFTQMESFTWNFTEAGHGKGPMDGVGGTLKREADKKVLRGSDITCAKDFVDALSSFNIDLYEIPSAVIEDLKLEVNNLTIPLIKGIMQVHQVTCGLCTGIMYCRKLSCFKCSAETSCRHYKLSEVFPTDDQLFITQNKIDSKQKKPSKLSVDDVFTSSEDEEYSNHYDQPELKEQKDLTQMYKCNTNKEDFAKKVTSGVHVLVEYKIDKGKKSKIEQFIGVCQNDLSQEDVTVMFLKFCNKDNQLYFANEKDVVSVPGDQIKAILPTPTVVLKGNRVFYRFKKANVD